MSIRSANIFVLMLCQGGLAGCTKNDFETQWSECEMEAAKHFPVGFMPSHKAGYHTDPDESAAMDAFRSDFKSCMIASGFKIRERDKGCLTGGERWKLCYESPIDNVRYELKSIAKLIFAREKGKNTD